MSVQRRAKRKADFGAILMERGIRLATRPFGEMSRGRRWQIIPGKSLMMLSALKNKWLVNATYVYSYGHVYVNTSTIFFDHLEYDNVSSPHLRRLQFFLENRSVISRAAELSRFHEDRTSLYYRRISNFSGRVASI
jgi:hypothetical protein